LPSASKYFAVVVGLAEYLMYSLYYFGGFLEEGYEYDFDAEFDV